MKYFVICIIVIAASCASSKSIRNVNGDDGSSFVCNVLRNIKADFECTKTSEIPNSNQFKDNTENPIWGDIIWWKDYMGIFDPVHQSVLTSKGNLSLDSLIKAKGNPKYYIMKSK